MSRFTPQYLLQLGCMCVIALAACDEGTVPSPVWKPAPVAVAPSSSVVRTVETRNPFGDTANATNLMIDGDFEITGRSEQMPWITFTSAGQSTLNYATGGKCRSGVRCASIASGTELVGYFASPKTGAMTASLWAHPDSGKCGDVQVSAFNLDDQQSGNTSTLTVANQDAGGWCNFTGSIPNMADAAPVIYVTVSNGVALIDDGVVLPEATGESSVRRDEQASSSESARRRFISDWVRTHRRF